MNVTKEKNETEEDSVNDRDTNEKEITDTTLDDREHEKGDSTLYDTGNETVDLTSSTPFKRSSKMARSPPPMKNVKRSVLNVELPPNISITPCSPAVLSFEPLIGAGLKKQTGTSTGSGTSIPSEAELKRKRTRGKRRSVNYEEEDELENSSDSRSSDYNGQSKKIVKRFTPPDKKTLRRDKAARSELADCNVDDLEAAIQENTRIIDEVISKSSNLKGGCVKDMREAASRIRAASLYLYAAYKEKKDTTQKGNDDMEDKMNNQIKELKDRVSTLEEEKKRLEGVVQELKSKTRKENGRPKSVDTQRREVSTYMGIPNFNEMTRQIINEIKETIPQMIKDAISERPIRKETKE